MGLESINNNVLLASDAICNMLWPLHTKWHKLICPRISKTGQNWCVGCYNLVWITCFTSGLSIIVHDKDLGKLHGNQNQKVGESDTINFSFQRGNSLTLSDGRKSAILPPSSEFTEKMRVCDWPRTTPRDIRYPPINLIHGLYCRL